MSYAFRLDLSMDAMEETRIKKKYLRFIKNMTRKYHFSKPEVEMLVLIFHKLMNENDLNLPDCISKRQFRSLLHSAFNMTDDALMERIFTALETRGSFHPATVSMETWTSAMSLFLRGTLEEKIDHCFTVYNIMGDGFIARDNIFTLMRKSLVSRDDDDAEESVKDMIEVISMKMDLDRDGKISYDDYRTSVLNEPMLLECFGQCLPSRIAVHTFLSTLLPNAGRL